MALAFVASVGWTGPVAARDTDKHVFGPRAPSINESLNLRQDRKEPRVTSAEIRAAVWRELDIGESVEDDWTQKEVTPPDYTAAGYNYVYRQCSNYFDALIKLQNKTGMTGDIVSSGGSTTGAILGLAKVSSAAIGIVAAGFGFAGSMIGSFEKRALMTPYPTETKQLILRALDAYRVSYPPNNMASAAEAILNVQHYAELCTYSGITRGAKEAISSVKAEVVPAAGFERVTLASAITTKLGLSTPLTDEQLVALYWFTEKADVPCSDAALCKKAADALLVLKDQIGDAAAGYNDPAPLKKKIGGELNQLYARDPAFAAQVAAFATKKAVSPPAKGKPQKAAVVPVDTAKSNNYRLTVDGPSILMAPTDGEKFGQIDYNGRKQEPAVVGTDSPR